MISIAIDGPSGAGKSSLAKVLASRLGFIYLDTGALYRAIGLHALRMIGDGYSEDPDGVVALLDALTLEIRYLDGTQHVFVNGDDVSTEIRTQKVAAAASYVSAIPAVRAYLLDLQRGFAERENVIMDGRDVGTVILPNATVKIFLTASAEVRARRRCDELLAKGAVADYATILAEINQRDLNDSSRAIAPLKAAEDAVILDNSEIDLEGTIEAAYRIIRSKTPCCIG